jgi:hypothetical protein
MIYPCDRPRTNRPAASSGAHKMKKYTTPVTVMQYLTGG